MRVLYSAADALVIPSRQDNLPNTGVEALSCGTPVVAFDVCGMPDLVQHRKTGYLAQAFDADDLASGISWILESGEEQRSLRANSREYALAQFSYESVATQYRDIYADAMESSGE